LPWLTSWLIDADGFLRRIFWATKAVIPPVPVALPAIMAAVAMQTGHMVTPPGDGI
jgi:hypothetical protein